MLITCLVVTFAFSTYADGAARRRMICPNFGGNMVTSVRESEEIVLVLPCTHGWGGYQDIETEIVRTTVYNCGSRGNRGSAVTRLPGRSYCSHDLWWAVFFQRKKQLVLHCSSWFVSVSFRLLLPVSRKLRHGRPFAAAVAAYLKSTV